MFRVPYLPNLDMVLCIILRLLMQTLDGYILLIENLRFMITLFCSNKWLNCNSIRKLNVQSNWWEEFQSLTTFLEDNVIIHRLSCPLTYHQHGIVECTHRHITETGLALLARAQLINRLPTPTIKNQAPLQKLFGKLLVLMQDSHSKDFFY